MTQEIALKANGMPELWTAYDALPSASPLPSEIQAARNTEFYDEENFMDFVPAFRGLIYGMYNEIDKQIAHYNDKCLDIIKDDKACAAIGFAKEMGMDHVRPFCIAGKNYNGNFTVESDHPYYWQIQDAHHCVVRAICGAP